MAKENRPIFQLPGSPCLPPSPRSSEQKTSVGWHECSHQLIQAVRMKGRREMTSDHVRICLVQTKSGIRIIWSFIFSFKSNKKAVGILMMAALNKFISRSTSLTHSWLIPFLAFPLRFANGYLKLKCPRWISNLTSPPLNVFKCSLLHFRW